MLLIQGHYALELFSTFGPSIFYYFGLSEDIADLNLVGVLKYFHYIVFH